MGERESDCKGCGIVHREKVRVIVKVRKKLGERESERESDCKGWGIVHREKVRVIVKVGE